MFSKVNVDKVADILEEPADSRRASIITGTRSASPMQFFHGMAAQGSPYSKEDLSVIAVTGNMGNHSLDKFALIELIELIKATHVDLLVLNVQEADYLKIQWQLDEALNGKNSVVDEKEYIVGFVRAQPAADEVPSVMGTKTKPLAFNTGIATLFIYKNTSDIILSAAEIDAEHPYVKIQRRHGTDENLRSKGSANNKCGMVSRLVVTKLGQEFRVDVMSAHLDADTVSQRLKDWLVMYNLVHPTRIGDYEILAELVSDTLIIGMDANVRDQAFLADENLLRTNLFEIRSLEVAPFLNAGLGPIYATRKTSYHDDAHAQELDHKAVADSMKRRGVFGESLFASGPLDLIGLSMPRPQVKRPIIHFIDNDEALHQTMSGRRLPVPEPGKAKRDHAMIISPLTVYRGERVETKKNRIKQFLINRLFATAPLLTKEVAACSVDDPKFEATMLAIYNNYLACSEHEPVCGLLPRFFKQHIRLVECLEQLTLQGLKDPKKTLTAADIEFFKGFFDQQGPWCELSGLWSSMRRSLSPLSTEYIHLLTIKYAYQELVYDAFSKARTVVEKKQVLYLAEKLLKQPGISPLELCQRLQFILEANAFIFSMEDQAVLEPDFQGMHLKMVSLWLTRMDFLHDSDSVYLSKLKQFYQDGLKLLRQAKGYKKLEDDPSLNKFIDAVGGFLQRVYEEARTIQESVQLAVETGTPGIKSSRHKHARSFFIRSRSLSEEDLTVSIGQALSRSESCKNVGIK
jgi:hypothetical protein